MLNEAISTVIPVENYLLLAPYHNTKFFDQYLRAIHQDMRSVDRFKHRLLHKKLTTSDKNVLEHYPLSYKKMTADKDEIPPQEGDHISDGTYPFRVIEIKPQGKGNHLITLQVTCPYYSFLYDYERIKIRLESDTYKFGSLNPKIIEQYEKGYGYKYYPAGWHLEFDACIAGEMPEKVLKAFFSNREAYHQTRKELAENHSASKNSNLKI